VELVDFVVSLPIPLTLGYAGVDAPCLEACAPLSLCPMPCKRPTGTKMRRFLCDEMLRRLGRWLRAAGYDAVIAAGGLPDRALAARCAKEDRILLSEDRHLATTS
jgi:hypothetical protein